MINNLTLNMWQQDKLLVLVVLLSTFTSLVHSSCDQISLPKCECKHPKDKRYEILCQSTGLSAMPSKVNYTLPDGDASGNFSYNSIDSIPDFYFVFMKHFNSLDFTSNRISEFNKDSLTGLETRLEMLTLKQNRISSIPETALSKYILLNKLDLGSNRISSPCQIHTVNIRNYSLSDNGIKEIGDLCFSDSNRVQFLDLSQNDITTIASEAFLGMTSLKVLDLGFNQLSEIGSWPGSLMDIDSFETLSLRGNHMQYMESLCTYNLPGLKSLDVGVNELLDIQKYCFRSYSAVQGPDMFLNFEHNKIVSLSEAAFAGLSERLTKLKLNNNKISEVNVNTFRDLSKLRILDVADNGISTLEFLRNWEDNSLVELSVANNLISQLSPRVFEKMLKLTTLNLDGNLLLNIQPSAFYGMVVLDDLSIRYNLLTNLADGAFSGLNQLKKMRLSGNALVTLKNCTFANLDRLVLFHFEDNLLLCDCDLLWLLPFRSAIDDRGIPDKSIYEPVLEDTCHYPEEYAGKDMVNVVSLTCQGLPSNACFGLAVTYEEPQRQAMNVSWSWDVDEVRSPPASTVLSQIDVKTNTAVTNVSVTSYALPYQLDAIDEETIYKICVSMVLDNGLKEIDCTVYPSMIKKPTTTMAPVTARMISSGGLGAGGVAAIILAIILIILIVLLIIAAVYLWRTRKWRLMLPTKYGNAARSDSDHDGSMARSQSSNGKADPLDFRASGEDEPMMIGRPSYEEHDV